MSWTLQQVTETFPDWPFGYTWNDNHIQFAKGDFDCWKVETDPKIHMLDIDWLNEAVRLADDWGKEYVYATFNRVYNLVTPDPYDRLSLLATSDMPHKNWLIWLRYALLAEERLRAECPDKPMGKRLKRLALHQTLYQSYTPAKAAKWSVGKSPSITRPICQKYGF